jgi:hypothetical protein
MWDPHHLTTLQASMGWYKDSFKFLFTAYETYVDLNAMIVLFTVNFCGGDKLPEIHDMETHTMKASNYFSGKSINKLFIWS